MVYQCIVNICNIKLWIRSMPLMAIGVLHIGIVWNGIAICIITIQSYQFFLLVSYVNSGMQISLLLYNGALQQQCIIMSPTFNTGISIHVTA